MLRMILVVGAISLSYPWAQTTKWGAGLDSCGEVISKLEVAENGEKHIGFLHGQWVLGFLSGVSMTDENLGKAISNLNADGISLWVINYCRENPLNDLIDASVSVITKKVAAKKK